MKSHKKAFTLIELLVVIAIIAILASILFPVFARARENARRASCQSNLKQIGLGIMQYSQDYDERLPGSWVGPGGENQTGGWVYYTTAGLTGVSAVFDVAQGGIYPYLKSTQIFVCPSDTEGKKSGNSYSINDCVLIQPSTTYNPGKSLAAFDDTARFMLLSEESTLNYSSDDGYQQEVNNTISDRHLAGSNVAFMDGHVKWFRPDKIIADQLLSGGNGTSCP